MKKFVKVLVVFMTLLTFISCNNKKPTIKLGYMPWVACSWETDVMLDYFNKQLGDKYNFEKVAINTSTEMITKLVEKNEVQMFHSEDGTIGSLIPFERGKVDDWRVKLENEKLKNVYFTYIGTACCEEFYVRKDLNISNMAELKEYSDKNGGINFAITTGYFDRGENHNSGKYLLEFFGLKANKVVEMSNTLLSAAVGAKEVDFAVNMEIMPPTHDNCIQIKGEYDKFFLPQNNMIIANKEIPTDVLNAMMNIKSVFTQEMLEQAILESLNK